MDAQEPEGEKTERLANKQTKKEPLGLVKHLGII
jgi:hypothetical protein